MDQKQKLINEEKENKEYEKNKELRNNTKKCNKKSRAAATQFPLELRCFTLGSRSKLSKAIKMGNMDQKAVAHGLL